MHPTKEELNSKWWHRLSKVLGGIFALAVVSYFAFILDDGFIPYYFDCKEKGEENCDIGLLKALLLTMAFALITYFVFWLIYKKIILYIVFGKKTK